MQASKFKKLNLGNLKSSNCLLNGFDTDSEELNFQRIKITIIWMCLEFEFVPYFGQLKMETSIFVKLS